MAEQESRKAAVAYAEAERRIAAAREATELDLSVRHLARIPSLAGLTALQLLRLESTQVSDLTPLADLPALQVLDLSRTPVSDLTPLSGLTTLQSLGLRHTAVSDLRPLSSLHALQSLNLGGTGVSDLAPLAGLVALHWLDLWDTQISDLTPLAGLAALQSLNLRSTGISGLAPLAKLIELRSLDLMGSKVTDLTPLANLTGLIEAAKGRGGLFFANCPLVEEKLREHAGIDNPERTIKTINYLRVKAGLPPHLPDDSDKLITALREDPLGAGTRVEGSHIVLVLDTGNQPRGNKNDMEQAYREIIRKAQLLCELCRGLDNYPEWRPLKETAKLFLQEIERPLPELGERSVTLWSLSVSLGSYLEQDRETGKNPQAFGGMLEPRVRRGLSDLVVTAANFVRNYETPRIYDAGLIDAFSPPAATKAAQQIAMRAGQRNILRYEDGIFLIGALGGKSPGGSDTRKAHGFGLKTVMNVMVTAFALIRGGGLKKAAERFVERSPLVDKLVDLFEHCGNDVNDLYEGAAPDIRETVRELVIREQKKHLPKQR
jgi:hypothetical protein